MGRLEGGRGWGRRSNSSKVWRLNDSAALCHSPGSRPCPGIVRENVLVFRNFAMKCGEVKRLGVGGEEWLKLNSFTPCCGCLGVSQPAGSDLAPLAGGLGWKAVTRGHLVLSRMGPRFSSGVAFHHRGPWTGFQTWQPQGGHSKRWCEAVRRPESWALEPPWRPFPHILLDRAGPKSSPDSRVGETGACSREQLQGTWGHIESLTTTLHPDLWA